MNYYLELLLWGLSVIIFLALLKRCIEGPSCSYHPSLEGKVVIVTGANTGVGFTAAEGLAQLNP